MRKSDQQQMADKSALKTRVENVLDDPGAKPIARMYANAFLATLPADKAEGTLEEFGSFLADVVDRNPKFATTIYSLMVSRDDKIALIKRVLTGRASELFVSFLCVLAHHDRLDLLPLIFQQSRLQHEIQSGKQRVQVTSAKPLSNADIQSIQTSLRGAFPFEPIVEAKVDPSLLGGLRVRVGDTVYDSSLRTRLKQFGNRLRDRSLHEIQSGRNRFSHPEGD